MVQDPDEALFPDMPRHAINEVKVDYVAPIAELAQILVEQVCDDCDEVEPEHAEQEDHHVDPTEMNIGDLRIVESHGNPSMFTCPECNGTLFELHDNGIRYYRCRVGHSYTPETLEAHQTEELEAALWEALRSLEENLGLSKRLLEKAKDAHRSASENYYVDKVKTGERRVELLRTVLAHTIGGPRGENGPL